jgi:hypothetical protein
VASPSTKISHSSLKIPCPLEKTISFPPKKKAKSPPSPLLKSSLKKTRTKKYKKKKKTTIKTRKIRSKLLREVSKKA